VTEESASESSEHSGVSAAPERFGRLWRRVHEHKVLQWALAYLGAALAIAHGTELLGANFHWPEIIGRLVMGLLIVGFPFALVLAWYHGHKGLVGVGRGEMMIVSLLLVIGAGLLVMLVRVRAPADAGHAVGRAQPVAQASVAVLPFKDFSPSRDQEYFADGVAEAILNSLAALHDLKVSGRTSAFYFKGREGDLRAVAQALGVAHVLEGSVSKAGNQLKITAQLTDARTGYVLWSRTYERPLDDVFKIQEDIATSVAQSLAVTLGVGAMHAPGMTHNIDAYDAFLAARAQVGEFTRESMLRGIDEYQRAIALDPTFAIAWRGLAELYRGLAPEILTDESAAVWRARSDAAIEEVRRLTPQADYVPTLLAERSVDAGRWNEAARYFLQAAAVRRGSAARAGVPDPGDGLPADFLLDVGRFKDAIPLLERQSAIDPLDKDTALSLAEAYAYVGNMPAAFSESERGLRMPGGDLFFRGLILETALATRDRATIERSLDALVGPHPGNGDVNAAMRPLLDSSERALVVLRQHARNAAGNYVQLVIIAQWMAYFGAPGEALDIMRSQFIRSAPLEATLTILWRPGLRDMRRLPAFKQYVSDLGLVGYWREFGWADVCHPALGNDFTCT